MQIVKIDLDFKKVSILTQIYQQTRTSMWKNFPLMISNVIQTLQLQVTGQDRLN